MSNYRTIVDASGNQPKRRKRVFRWVFLAIQLIFLIWIIAGVATTTHNPSCSGLDAQTCQSATDAGATIGAFLIIMLWALVDVIMGVTWMILRHTRKGNN